MNPSPNDSDREAIRAQIHRERLEEDRKLREFIRRGLTPEELDIQLRMAAAAAKAARPLESSSLESAGLLGSLRRWFVQLRTPVGLTSAMATIAVALTATILLLRPSGPFKLAMSRDDVRGATGSNPPFIEQLGKEVQVKFSVSHQTLEFLVGKKPVSIMCRLTNSPVLPDRLWVGSASVAGTLEDGRTIIGTGEIRVRSKVSRSKLTELRQDDLDWVSVQVTLSAGNESGKLGLSLGTP